MPSPRVPRNEPADPFFLGLLALGAFCASILAFVILVSPRVPLPDFDVASARPYLPVRVPRAAEPASPKALARIDAPSPDLAAPRAPSPAERREAAQRSGPGGSGITQRIARFFGQGDASGDSALLEGLGLQASPKGPGGLRTFSPGGGDRALTEAPREATGAPRLSYFDDPSVALELVIQVIEPPGAEPAPDGVEEVVRRMSGRLRACYESELRSRPGLEGRIVLVWDVYDGRVHDISIEEDGFQIPSFSECLVQKVKAWRFPPASEGTTRWPFHFQQGR